MSEAITWTNEKRRLGELIPWAINPATIDKAEAKRLEESLDEFGQVETLAISPTGELYDGHQRQVVWGASKKFGPDYVVDVRVSSRELTEQERKKLVIYLRKGAVGHFDFDVLANNWDTEDLLNWGFKPYELGMGEGPNDPNEEWKGMPEFDQDEDVMGDYHTIKVHFATAEDLEAFAQLVGQTVTDKSKFIWYPKRERENLKAYRVKDES